MKFNHMNDNQPGSRMLFCSNDMKSHSETLQLLADSRFQVLQETKITGALKTLNHFIPELVVIDSSGNELIALEFCTSVKSSTRLKNILLVFLGNRMDESIEEHAFSSGADDFVQLPLNPKAFLERIKTRLKRPGKTITINNGAEESSMLKIDRESYSVSVGNQFVQLSKIEFELLYLFASHPEKLFRREEIFNQVWNKQPTGKIRTIDVHIVRLRQKLGNRYIHTQKGIGYRFIV